MNTKQLAPLCPSCGRSMRFAQSVPMHDGHDLLSFACRPCGLTISEAANIWGVLRPTRSYLVREKMYARHAPITTRHINEMAMGSRPGVAMDAVKART